MYEQIHLRIVLSCPIAPQNYLELSQIFPQSLSTANKCPLRAVPYKSAGLGSILDTVSKDTEDTAPLVSVS